MTRDEVQRALRAALDRWMDQPEDASDAKVSAGLRHIEAFALASLAGELHEIALTLQARHEEAIERGTFPHARPTPRP